MTSPFVNTPLQQHGLLHTDSVDQARDVVASVYVPHTLETKAKNLDAVLNAVSSEMLTFGFLSYGATTTVVLPPMESCYHVNITLSGHSEITDQYGTQVRTRGVAGGAILFPDRQVRIAWYDSTRQYALKVTREVLESHLAAMINRPWSTVIPADMHLDLTSGAGTGLLRLLELYEREWDEDGVLVRTPASRRNLESLILSNLLLAAGSDRWAADTAGGPKGWCERVREDINSTVSELPTLTDIAARAGVSVRTMQRGFQEQYGVTPSAYIAGLRLERAHAELVDRAASGVTVTEVAVSCGFYHLSRFASAYRRRYGELPSETLRRYAA